ncbi:hypothetical protein, partial [Chishuiella sp.]|uniref:hypothetical protein n=1 Tax=Chishuiella sp. TaxID=1969467 RepID=UPI0028A8254B
MKYISKYNCDVFDVTFRGNLITVYENNLLIDGNKIDGKFNGFSRIDDKLFTYDINEDKTIFYSINTLESIYSLNNYLGIRNDIDKRKNRCNYFGQYESIDNEYWVFIDKNTYEIISFFEINIYNRSLSLIKDECFISKNKDLITLKNIINNETIWQQSFTDLLQSEEVLLRYYYIYQEKLILHLRTNGLLQNKYVSIVLDVNTGKELYRTEETLGKKLINGLGYTLYDQILWTSNPETYEVKRIDLSETLSPLNKIIDDKIGDVDLGKTEVKFR